MTFEKFQKEKLNVEEPAEIEERAVKPEKEKSDLMHSFVEKKKEILNQVTELKKLIL
jgi:hypothetical protein